MARDYILRMVEQMAALFAGVLAKERAGRLVEVRRDLDAICVQTIGLEVAALKGSSPEAIAQRLKDSGGLRHVRAISLAEVLLHHAETSPSDAPKESEAAGPAEVHAFCLLADSLEALDREDRAYYRAKAEKLAEQLGPYRRHPYLEERLRSLGLSTGE